MNFILIIGRFSRHQKILIRQLAQFNKMLIFAAPISFKIMKKDLHPKSYRMVVFKDISNDYAFLSKSTIETRDTIKWEDGNEYPLVKLEISHMSHPYYTGKIKLVDTAGRVDKFRSRYAKSKKQQDAAEK
jgi:large subunit ribosomal protein L31